MSCDAFLIDRILLACSPVDPCEKFNLATAIPASTSRLIVWIDEVAGPIVQTTLVFVFSELMLHTFEVNSGIVVGAYNGP